MYIIAIDGPDRCGKTEIAKGLDFRMSYSHRPTYYRASSQHEDFLRTPERFVQNLRYADTRMYDMILQMNLSIILDRSWASEWVYSRAFSRETDDYALRYIDDKFSELGAIIVLAGRSDYTNIVDDIDPDRLNGKKLQHIHDLFQEFSSWTKCKILHLNVDDEDLNREVEEIMSFHLNP